MNRKAITAGVVAAAALAAGLGFGPPSVASSATTMRFSNHLDTIVPVDVAPPGPSVGDSFYVGSHVVSGASGRTAASCTLVTTAGPGIRQCEVDFVLKHGRLLTRGLTNNASSLVHLVVVGGTGRYARMSGAGTLTPTKTGSDVVLRLH